MYNINTVDKQLGFSRISNLSHTSILGTSGEGPAALQDIIVESIGNSRPLKDSNRAAHLTSTLSSEQVWWKRLKIYAAGYNGVS